LVCLPENFAFVGKTRSEATDVAENLKRGDLFLRYRQLAMDNRVWLSLGGFPEKHPLDPTKRFCSHIILNDEGSIIANYKKMHVPDSVRVEDEYNTQIVTEHRDVLPGREICKPVSSPIGYLGLSVSYDLRFPEMFRQLFLKGVQVLLVPSSFMFRTGANHWEVLLRARAIEN